MDIRKTLEFEENLYKLINSCGLPVDTAFYVLKSVYLDFKHTLEEYAKKENGNGITTEEQTIYIDNSSDTNETAK